MRNAKIVCTLGPASDSVEEIRSLAEAGMSVARLNASYGSPGDRRDTIDRVEAVDARRDEPVAIMHDIPGPEVRTADIEEPIHLEADSRIRFYEGDNATPREVGLSLDISAVDVGDRILLDDGRIETTVEEVDGTDVYARVGNSGRLASRESVNVPGVGLGLPVITETDSRELEVAADRHVDFVAASFVRDGSDINEIQDHLDDLGVEIPVVAKIERVDAVENLDCIIEAAYGIMVARGDLGVEMPLEEVPMIQKRIIRECNEAGVPVITATEMLDSMIQSRRPTRAEASDVANAVLDGTDAVMLSGETAVGDNPARVVRMMARIVRQVESTEEYDDQREQRVPEADESRADALAHAARYLSEDIGAEAIVAASESGYTARRAAKFRPGIPIVASTTDDRVRRRLALSWGIHPTSVPYTTGDADAIIRNSVQSALTAGFVRGGDTVVVVSGMMTELDGIDTSNLLKIHVAAETIVTGRAVVEGVVSGPLYRVTDGDLSETPDGSVVVVPEDELVGEPDGIRGVVSAATGEGGHAAAVARELDLPMLADAPVPDSVADGTTVTLDTGRGVLYRGAVAESPD